MKKAFRLSCVMQGYRANRHLNCGYLALRNKAGAAEQVPQPGTAATGPMLNAQKKKKKKRDQKCCLSQLITINK